METTNKNIKLIEHDKEQGVWSVRWNIQNKKDENDNETDIYEYQEEIYTWIPTIEDIQRTITEWHNKQTDEIIKHGFVWKDIKVLLSEENKFNFSLFAIEAERRENARKKWDEENPDLKGIDIRYIEGVDQDGNAVLFPDPVGRPSSRIPITFKLSESNEANSFYTFNTLEELFEFTSACADHLQAAYASGWYKIATFDWSAYVEALSKL